MVITLTMEQQRKLLVWAGEIARGHVDAEAEPPGYTFHIDMAPPWGVEAHAVCGNSEIELGLVSLKLS